MRHKYKKKIKFDAEVVTKDETEKIVEKSLPSNNVAAGAEYTPIKNAKQKKRRKRNNGEAEETEHELPTVETPIKQKKENLKQDILEEEQHATEEEQQNTESNQTETNEGKGTESIRAKKRKKHAQLMNEKKIKAEEALKQKCLNYLSRWKHNNSEWKFEKLKQLWLQRNMFDSEKVPDEFWDTLVEYFNSAKGKAKHSVLERAVEFVEKEQEIVDESDEFVVKLKRARDIIQNLQD